MRVAISRRRRSARTTSMFATFAQTTSSTAPVAPNIQSGTGALDANAPRPKWSLSAAAATARGRFVSKPSTGCLFAASRLRMTVVATASARRASTPGASRATTFSHFIDGLRTKFAW